MTNADKAVLIALDKYMEYDDNTTGQIENSKEECYNSAMAMAEYKDAQYLSTKFIGEVLRLAETYRDKRNLSAVAAQIANEMRLRMDDKKAG